MGDILRAAREGDVGEVGGSWSTTQASLTPEISVA
jgi:hypothetical protein